MNDLNDTTTPSRIGLTPVPAGLERADFTLDTYPKTEEQMEAMHRAFATALRLLPPGTVVHKTDVYYEAEKLPFQGAE